jgi:hypothetical protein
MMTHAGFEIPGAFLQLDGRCPLPSACRIALNDPSLQGGYSGWQRSTERA